jgi:hypothetical protein
LKRSKEGGHILNQVEIIEKRSFIAVIVGLLFLCMALASLLTVRGLSEIPQITSFTLSTLEITVDVHSLIYLLATPSLYVASLWGDESMVISIAFLFLGLGFSLIFKKKISSRLRKS